MVRVICPTCHQAMNDEPRLGLRGKNCVQCGQGISWRQALQEKRKRRRQLLTEEVIGRAATRHTG